MNNKQQIRANPADPLLVTAECRWVTIEGKKRKYPVAGFELKDAFATDEKPLKNFIDFFLLSKSGEWQIVENNPLYGRLLDCLASEGRMEHALTDWGFMVFGHFVSSG